MWDSANINKRAESLFELIKHNLAIANKGNKLTFMNSVRHEVLDLTLTSQFITTKIKYWHVSSEESKSNHRHIRYDLRASVVQIGKHITPKITDWTKHRELFSRELEDMSLFETVEDLDQTLNSSQETIITTYENNCPLKQKSTNRDVPWWNKELSLLKSKAGKLFNRAKRSECWRGYKTVLTEYNKLLRKSRRYKCLEELLRGYSW